MVHELQFENFQNILDFEKEVKKNGDPFAAQGIPKRIEIVGER